ncbi:MULTISPECIES: class I ribonucleotide reductase maintenance protein YfaE [Pseudoalteromonas]|jgi:ferredoxin|uniref:Ferredoxin n=2 Tax=Pseudoalteromonas aliena TaxID=247523 RepID=A0A1Q2H1U6_9GAMM|nr:MULTISPECIES: class I ribonucleotide reductase maintenance protein YfaE [Pseudoalteromonas]AQQ01327.1 ferredoxin [Pseudoalteromonas aliena]MBB1386343.1 2Fe-2S ferredoxin-like protein [Pseudoalteromonas sp. SG45-5]MBB1394263.1 2Fe-2S ferredoxin-like protein [Pseudoalteromonas sp. SG44-4]MBB1447203.1 2Fe-2S ferredoxin-like protein [Pseudoalteromonas sp. SG41-6]MBE0359200.1 ferredoxin [Pseudoalteromonas aliena SW19]
MSDSTTASITLAQSSQRIEFNTGCPSLLHCLESKKIDVAFQCREGYCGACRAILVSGNVEYNEEPLAFVREGEILLCCCKPNGNISINLK